MHVTKSSDVPNRLYIFFRENGEADKEEKYHLVIFFEECE
jgi:hypothetical protein